MFRVCSEFLHLILGVKNLIVSTLGHIDIDVEIRDDFFESLHGCWTIGKAFFSHSDNFAELVFKPIALGDLLLHKGSAAGTFLRLAYATLFLFKLVWVEVGQSSHAAFTLWLGFNFDFSELAADRLTFNKLVKHQLLELARIVLL